jgi:hypothetical protein
LLLFRRAPARDQLKATTRHCSKIEEPKRIGAVARLTADQRSSRRNSFINLNESDAITETPLTGLLGQPSAKHDLMPPKLGSLHGPRQPGAGSARVRPKSCPGCPRNGGPSVRTSAQLATALAAAAPPSNAISGDPQPVKKQAAHQATAQTEENGPSEVHPRAADIKALARGGRGCEGLSCAAASHPVNAAAAAAGSIDISQLPSNLPVASGPLIRGRPVHPIRSVLS